MFRVGDLIKGTKKADIYYCKTNSEMIVGKVLSVDQELKTMNIEILCHKDECCRGETYHVEMEYFELIEDIPYNNIVKILSVPFDARDISDYIGTIIDPNTAMNLINNYNYTCHGIKDSTIYFIPHLKTSANSQVWGIGHNIWGLGHNIKDIYYIDITQNNLQKNFKEMTVEEIEEKLGYKIKIVDKKENN